MAETRKLLQRDCDRINTPCERAVVEKMRASRRFRIVFFLGQMPIGIQLPFLILYMKYDLGLNESAISILTALSGLTIILFQQPWGYAADVLFPKKALLIFTLLVSGVLFWMLGTLKSFPLLVGTFFLFQIFSTPIIQLLQGLLFSNPGSERWFGTFRAYASLGFVVANVGVGIAADRFANGNLSFIFPLYVAANALTALWIASLPEPRISQNRQSGFWDVQMHFLRRPVVRLFLLTSCLYQLGHSLSYSLQSVLMVELGADMRLVSSSYSLAALLELPVFFAAHKLLSGFGAERLMAFAAATQCVRWLLVWMSRSAEAILAISAVHFITFGVFYVAAISFINSHSPQHLKASGQTLFALVYFGMANLLSNLLGGQLVRGGILEEPLQKLVALFAPSELATPLRNLYLLSSLWAFLAFLLALRLVRKRCEG